MIRVPVNVAEEIRKLRYVERILTQELKRKPTTQEIADRMKVHESRVEELLSIAGLEPVSLDANQGQGKTKEEIDE
jgi:DNA-directed RNA polymerase sigma subunit (sigma70/sigma32)